MSGFKNDLFLLLLLVAIIQQDSTDLLILY